jgi:thymidylate kinase
MWPFKKKVSAPREVVNVKLTDKDRNKYKDKKPDAFSVMLNGRFDREEERLKAERLRLEIERENREFLEQTQADYNEAMADFDKAAGVDFSRLWS